MHSLSHPGVAASVTHITARFFWPNIWQVITNWARACLQCQHAKVQSHVRAPLGVFSLPEKLFLTYSCRNCVSSGCSYVLTCIDRFSRWHEATPISDIMAGTISKIFVSTWVSRFGCPERITTDRGRQSKASLFREFSWILGIQRIHTSYHPAFNGIVERFHRQLKAALRASNSLERWSETLSIVLLGCRSAIKSDLEYSVSELLYDTSLALPGTMFTPVNNSSTNLSSYVARLRSYFTKLHPMATQTTCTHVPRDMDKWTHVFVRNDAVGGPLNSPI